MINTLLIFPFSRLNVTPYIMQVVKISQGQFPPSFFISRCKSKNKKSTKQVDFKILNIIFIKINVILF